MVNRRDFMKNTSALLTAMELGAVISLTPNGLDAKEPKKQKRKNSLAKSIKTAQKIPTVCLNCSTVCGMTAFVEGGELLGVEGNPLDPNTNGKLCAKAHGGVSATDYPERIVYPLKRVGKRGDGLWQRITMEEAYETIASKIKICIDDGHPERVVFHAGRNRIDDITTRFMDAIGSPVILNHRALCSSNKRAANYATIGDTDWETVDAEHCKYFLNFGANFLEAHQGGFPMLSRYVKAKASGAKLVTFDVRLSNTAGRSDEWFAPFPSSEGAIALAMANVIIGEKLYDKSFIDEWVNVSLEEIAEFVRPYTPEFAELESGIAATDIRRLAREFAAAAPACAAFTNRGSQAHQNGFNNDRAVVMLNMLVGSIGKKGGYCFGGSKNLGDGSFPMPKPVPPKPKFSTDLEDPKAYPLANKWQKMKVGEIVYDMIKNKKQRVDVYLSYTISSPQTWPEGPSVSVDVLRDEKLIPFHVCSDVVYSQMAHYADIILPDATYFERYTIEGRNANELTPYFLLRQPVIKPPYDCENFADTLIKIAKRLGEPVSKYFDFENYGKFIEARLSKLPAIDGMDGFSYISKYGVIKEEKPKNYEPHKKKLSQKELENTFIEDNTVFIKKGDKKEAIGVVKDGAVYKGVKTPSRKYEIFSKTVLEAAKKVGEADDGWPHYKKPLSLAKIKKDEFVLTTFKWNVHTQARTGPQKYLTEIVHDNPAWINAATAKKLGIKSGDTIEIATFRQKSGYGAKEDEIVGRLKIKAFVTEGIHPSVVAVSASLGMGYGGRIAKAKNGKKQNINGFSDLDDPDFDGGIWWDERLGGFGNGFNPNGIIPINPSPLVGMQSWNDTVCKIKKIKG